MGWHPCTLLLWRKGGGEHTEFPPTKAGLEQAHAVARAGDQVLLESCVTERSKTHRTRTLSRCDARRCRIVDKAAAARLKR